MTAYRILLLFFLSVLTTGLVADWGFFAHRRINRLAIFTLPPEMIGFYKQHLEYISEHAVDPDKRRYATKYEAVRHYIDIDHWGSYPFDQVPRRRTDALLRYASLGIISSSGDTTYLVDSSMLEMRDGRLTFTARFDPRRFAESFTIHAYRRFFQEQVLPQYYEDEWLVDCTELARLTGSGLDCRSAFVIDHFSEYGVLPYHLLIMQRSLTEAFRQGSVARILRLSAEMGHYLGDAHVPLHTTENYNGQLTGQQGIHAFWESRIPELFADDTYDFFVGKAVYIEDPQAFFWEIVLSSHRLVAEVLRTERELRESFPRDKQYCFEERLGRTVRTECREYARAYQERLDGQIEQRMRQAILAIGTAWYTAWVDAGQPNLDRLGNWQKSAAEIERARQLDEQFQGGKLHGRSHN